MAKKSTSSDEIRVPSLREADPEYRRLAELKDDIEGKLNDALQEAESISRFLRSGKKLPAPGRAARIAELLGEDTQLGDQQGERDWTGDYRSLTSKIADYRGALAQIEHRLRAARAVASQAVCKAIEADFRAAMRRVAGAMLDASKAHVLFEDIIEQLNDHEVSWAHNLPNVQASRLLGSRRTGYPKISVLLAEYAAAGLIDAEEIPARIK